MTYKFRQSSLQKRETLHPKLIAIVDRVLDVMDIKIISGHRGEQEQDSLFNMGYSKKRFPDSWHNSNPSRAVDLAPCPINWKDRDRFILMAGIFLGIANMLGIGIKWGGDWNMNTLIQDESFQDLGHFELLDSEE